jgi:hypothetical protein
MEFHKTGTPEFDLVMKAFDIDISKEKCRYCKEQLQVGKHGLMPKIKEDEQYVLICDSTLCLAEYLEDAGC